MGSTDTFSATVNDAQNTITVQVPVEKGVGSLQFTFEQSNIKTELNYESEKGFAVTRLFGSDSGLLAGLNPIHRCASCYGYSDSHTVSAQYRTPFVSLSEQEQYLCRDCTKLYVERIMEYIHNEKKELVVSVMI